MPATTLLASTPTKTFPIVMVDPVDLVMIDIATGRYLPGSAVHASQLAHDHGIDVDAAIHAIESAWQRGLLTRVAGFRSGIVIWSPEVTQIQLHRLARAMVASAVAGQRTGRACSNIIDGEQQRLDVVDLFDLSTPTDVDLFLDLARALLGTTAPTLVDDLVVPASVFLTDVAQTVYGFEFAADAPTRELIVCDMVRSLIDGRVDDFTDLVADYVVAVSID